MADEGVPDYDLDTIDWIYVEDDFPLADELAESQIPDPGYAGTMYELAMEEMDDFDLFDYWDDLHYGDDVYWDHPGTAAQSFQKRKRTSAKMPATDGKRRKLSLRQTGGGSVRFVSMASRCDLSTRRAPGDQKRVSFALLPDWRERFANDSGMSLTKEMPAAMKDAAEGVHEGMVTSASVDDVENGDDEDYEGEEDAMRAELARLDPEMLKTILRQKLGDAGLNGMDEAAFMSSISKMLAGEDGADNAADDLANSLLDQATQGNDAALSGWLSQQGVSLDTADEDEDSVAASRLPDMEGGIKKMQSSPSDSAVGMLKAVGAATSELAIHLSSPTSSAKKRPLPSGADEVQEDRKRKKVSFDAPTSSDSASAPTHHDGENVMIKDSTILTSEDPLMSETTIHDGKARVAKTKAANAIAVENNHNAVPDSSIPKPPAAKGSTQSIAATKNKSDEPAAAPAPAKNTRKRKAQVEDESEKAAPRKQAKNASAPAEAAGRRTRSTRATTKVGK